MTKHRIVASGLVLLCTQLVLLAAPEPAPQQPLSHHTGMRNPATERTSPAIDPTPAARKPDNSGEAGSPTGKQGEVSAREIAPGAKGPGAADSEVVSSDGSGINCADPIELTLSQVALPLVHAGTTCGAGNDYQDTCLGNYDGGEDIIYAVTVTDPMTVRISLVGAAGSRLGVSIDTACPPGATCLAKATGYCCPTIAQVSLTPGVYYILIDNWPPPGCAAYTMTISSALQGACCLPDGSCSMGGVSECTAQGGVYQGDNTDCASVNCVPERPCPSMTPVDVDLGAIGTDLWGYSVSGNCGHSGKWVGQFAAETGAAYHFDLCAEPPGNGTANFDIDIKICDAAGTIVAGQDGACGTAHRPNDFLWNALAAGTYFVVLAPYPSYDQHNCTGTSAATFTLNYYNAGVPASGACCLDDASCIEVVPAICAAQYGTYMGDNTACGEVACYPCGECPPDGVPEPEPCGMETDGGCNSTPARFAPISCGQTVCGTAWANTDLRDTDWYELIVSEASHITWSVEADFPLVIFIYRATIAGSCEGLPTQLSWLNADACETATLSVDGYAGEAYWFLALPSDWFDLPCPGHYTGTLTCTPLPTGACCLPDGACSQYPAAQCTAEYGTYHGDDSSCDDVVCLPCAVCPEGGVPEQEACGSNTNDGCNGGGFEPITPGETVCGTLWADVSLRDTDWYQLETTTFNSFTWTGEGQIPLLLFVLQGPDCAHPVTLGNTWALPCQTATITTPVMPPGTYWFFAGAAMWKDWPCENDYFATLTCTEYPPQYCAAASASTLRGYISNMACDGLNNSSSYSHYSDYTSLVATIPVGGVTTLTVTNGNPYVGDGCRAWVDWNHNYIFEPGEVVGSAGPGSGPYDIHVTPPSSALLGATRMRIRVWNNYYSTGNACGTESNGEVEDYTVNLIEVQGACCQADGTCAVLLPSECTGGWAGPYIPCSGNDCNANGRDDLCDILSGMSGDCDGNGIPDECQPFIDCNGNGAPDFCDLVTGYSQDCNENGIPDECDVASGFSRDCQNDLVPDECQLSGSGTSVAPYDDGSSEGSLGGPAAMCWIHHFSGVNNIGSVATCFGTPASPGASGVSAGTAFEVFVWDDPDGDGTLNDAVLLARAGATVDGGSIDTDVFQAVRLDSPVAVGASWFVGVAAVTAASTYPGPLDNNGTLYHQAFVTYNVSPFDPETIAPANTFKLDDIGYPGNWLLRAIPGGGGADCNANGIPDDCDVPPICEGAGCSQDCQSDLIPDECQIENNDCNSNGRPDECDISSGTSSDCNLNGIPDECEIPPIGTHDCNGNGWPDDCDLSYGLSQDCNNNGVPDECDIASGLARDCQGDGIPDECQLGSGGDYPLQWDDGSSESAVGLTGGGELAWITHFTKPDGEPTCHVSAILTTFGSPAYAGSSGASPGQDLRVYVWNDPNGSGDPAQMVFVGEVTAHVEAGAIDSDNPQTVAVNLGVDITDSFFVGASFVHTNQHWPAAMDLNGTQYGQAWYGYSLTVFDPANPGTLYNMADSGYPCNWMLRVVVNCGAPENDCNTNGVPDECDIRAGTSLDANGNGIPDECESGLPGDMNCDGLVNAFDIDPFVLALTNPTGYQAAYAGCRILNADINGDGVVNSFDIDPFVLLLTGG